VTAVSRYVAGVGNQERWRRVGREWTGIKKPCCADISTQERRLNRTRSTTSSRCSTVRWKWASPRSNLRVFETICGAELSTRTHCNLRVVFFGAPIRRPPLQQLHWLPVRQRILYNPAYGCAEWTRLVSLPTWRNTSINASHLVRPVQLHYRYCLSRAWSLICKTFILLRHTSAYTEVKLCDPEHDFKGHLKTFLFNSCHQTDWPQWLLRSFR